MYILQFPTWMGIFHSFQQPHKQSQKTLKTNKTAVKVMMTSVKETMTNMKEMKKKKLKSHHSLWEETKHFNIFYTYVLTYMHT